MPHCTKCGASVGDNVGFCPNCGAQQSAPGAAAPAGISSAPSGTSGIAENVAGLLCYVLGWVTGLIFFLIDKRPFVRFHAAQSIVVFGGLTIVLIALRMVFIAGAFPFGFGLRSLVYILELVLWVLLMIKAYQGERFRVPIAADLADQLFGKS